MRTIAKKKVGSRSQAIYRSNLDYKALSDMDNGSYGDYSIGHTERGLVQILSREAKRSSIQVSSSGTVQITYTAIEELIEAIGILRKIAGPTLRLELRKVNASSDEMRRVYSLYITGHLQHPALCPVCMKEPMQLDEKSLGRRQLIKQYISEKAQRQISERRC